MSLTLKLSSLAIRTFSKPIANQIKAQAREHERFRRLCVSMAQGLHQIDMRLRLGNIRDNAADQKRAAADAAVRKLKPTSPTVKTQADTKAEEDAVAKAKAAAEEAAKPQPRPHIRPLSESKAIESGATFISEAFLFLVAGGLIVFESWRSRRKENTRREDVESRLAELEESEKAARRAFTALETELLQLKAKQGILPKSPARILPRDVWEEEGDKNEAAKVEEGGWFSQISSWFSFGESTEKPAEPVKESQSAATDSKPSDNPQSPVQPSASVNQVATSSGSKSS